MTKTEIVHQFYVSLAKGDFEKVGSLLADDLVMAPTRERGCILSFRKNGTAQWRHFCY